MIKVAFVFSSKLQKDYPGSLKQLNPALKDFDSLYLCSGVKEKILKKDIDLDLEVLKSYDLVCPVGGEALKYVCKLTGITKYNGMKIENRYVPIMDPGIISFKPQCEKDIKDALKVIENAMNGVADVKQHVKDYKFISTPAEFKEYIKKLYEAERIVVDIETSGLSFKQNEIIGVAFTVEKHSGVFVDKAAIAPFIDELRILLKTKPVIMHNAKFDQQFLKEEYDWEFDNIDDTMLLHYCLEEAVGTHGLKGLAMKYTDLGDYEKDLQAFKKDFCKKHKLKLEEFSYAMVPMDVLAVYACKDADATMQLFEKMYPLVLRVPNFINLYKKILMPASWALRQVEMNGGPLDVDYARRLEEDYLIDVEETIEEIKLDPAVVRYEHIHQKSFNPNSTMQLREVFFNILKLTPIKKTDSGAWSTDKEVLAEIEHPLADSILELRQKSKMLETYIRSIISAVDPDGRLRSSFNIHGTTSGRLSSSGNLNYQNIPRDNKDIKKLFKARDGYKIVQGDLATAEVYYAGILSNDKFIQKAFIEKLDFHSYVAKQIFNLPCEVHEVKKFYKDHRQWAKAITFGIMYQAGPRKIAEQANIEYEVAKEFIGKYFKEARDLKVFIDKSNSFIEQNGYIWSYFGRKRRLPESESKNRGVAGHAIRSGVNFLVQSVASDINLMGFADAMRWIADNNLQKEIIPFTLVHDSIVAEVKDEYVDEWVNKSRAFIQTDRGLTIPNCPIGVDYNIGQSWGTLGD